MPELVATTPGLYPLPDWAKDDLADLKGHQRDDLISGDESQPIREVYEDARSEIITLQHEAGLGRIVEGQLRWDDMLGHPLCVHSDVETRGLVRYYDNNNFYREPVVSKPLGFSGDIARELEHATKLTDNLQAVIPGPYSLAKLATNNQTNNDSNFLSSISSFLSSEVDAFPTSVNTLFLLEPSLVTNPPSPDLHATIINGIETITKSTNAEVIVHTYWGSFTDTIHEALRNSVIDGIGYDLVTSADETHELIADQGTKQTVALGLVDGQNTFVESPQDIRQGIESFTESIDVDTVYVTSNTELFYLPVNKFKEKLAVLGEAVQPEVPVQ